MNRAAALALLAGCRGPLELPTPPAGVDWLAAVFEDERGQFQSATALTAYQAGGAASFPLPNDAERLRLRGWGQGRVAALSRAHPGRPGPDPLAKQADCAPPMPAADFEAVLRVDGEVVGAPDPLLLTAPWIDQCPDLGTELELHAPCAPLRCAPQLHVAECRLELDMADCGDLTLAARMDPEGHACADRVEPERCRVVDGAMAGADLSVLCGECLAHLYLRPAILPLEVTPVAVVPGVEPRAISPGPGELNYRVTRKTGYFTDLSFFAGRVVVASQGGRFQELAPCTDPAPSELVFLDERSGLVTGRVPGPPCLLGLAADAGPSQLHGFARTSTTWRWHRFSLAGEALGSSALPLPVPVAGAYVHVDSLAFENFLIVVFTVAGSAPNLQDTSVLLLDALSGSVYPLGGFAGLCSSVELLSNGKLALANGTAGRIELLEIHSRRWLAPYELSRLQAMEDLHVDYDPGLMQLVVSVPRKESQLTSFGMNELPPGGRRLPINLRYAPYSSSNWPGARDLTLVGAVEEEQWGPSLFMFYNKLDRAFLPGHMAGGYGPPVRMWQREDDVWVAFPWEGKLWRLGTP